jgi:carbonic anhydrase/acetyltransferase-like protein (isoleucine patch superfamily)
MQPKYELVQPATQKHIYTSAGIIYCDVYRIKALQDFGQIKIGDIGGYVESEKNLSQVGTCWIDFDSIVVEHAIIGESAFIKNSLIYELAYVGGASFIEDSIIFGCSTIHSSDVTDSEIFDNADVCLADIAHSKIYGNADINTFTYNAPCTFIRNSHIYDNVSLSKDLNIDGLIINENVSLIGPQTLNIHNVTGGIIGDSIMQSIVVIWPFPASIKNPKYKLTTISKNINFSVVYQIEALRNFSDVKAGDLGGWIESDHNLSHEDDCWVYDNSVVYDQAQVLNDAKIKNNSEISERAIVKGNCIIDNYLVYGKAFINGDKTLLTISGNPHSLDNAIFGKANITGNTNLIDTSVQDRACINIYHCILSKCTLYGYATIDGNVTLTGCSVGDYVYITLPSPLVQPGHFNAENCMFVGILNLVKPIQILGSNKSNPIVVDQEYIDINFTNNGNNQTQSSTVSATWSKGLNNIEIEYSNSNVVWEFEIPENTTYFEYLNLVINKLLSENIKIDTKGSEYHFTYNGKDHILTNTTFQDNLDTLKYIKI